MGLHGEGPGGIVSLCLYTINLSILIFGFSTRRISFKSVYSFLLFHVTLRLAAQSVAIVTGTKDRLDAGLLIAFFVLAAEGYFSLVLCAYRFLIHHHQHFYPIDGSWLEGKPHENRDGGGKKDPWLVRFKRAMTARDKDGKKDPWVMTIIHWTLIAANTIIIVGGTRATGSDYNDADFWDRVHVGQVMRGVGQAIFLVVNILLALFFFLTVKQNRNPAGTLPQGWNHFFRVERNHGAIDAENRQPNDTIAPDLLVLIVAWPPLIVRGIFGLLQAFVPGINYVSPTAYTSTGFTKTFIVMENLFSVLPEWTACCLLCMTMFFKPTTLPHSMEAKRSHLGDTNKV
ncbi:uncharacterized protein L201_003846 [Kwoniella dendrophila CBS 6074]|uniref:Uncharacterized protein n=1 Tax=Kwoniella dendrophila CBS 6074 TaxID=1295534 RepID=A0AAX4JU12_9TREE